MTVNEPSATRYCRIAPSCVEEIAGLRERLETAKRLLRESADHLSPSMECRLKALDEHQLHGFVTGDYEHHESCLDARIAAFLASEARP